MSILFYDSLKLTPGRISGLSAWYDTSAAAYLRNGSAVAPSAGEGIAQMLDRSGNGNHTDVQATSTKRPTWTASQLNSLPLATFDNGDTLAITSKPTLFAIVNGANTSFIVAKRNTEAALVDNIFIMAEAAGMRYYTKFSATAGDVNFISRTADASLVTSSGNINTSYQILRGRRSGTTQAVAVDGGTEATNASGLDESGIDSAYIGSRLDIDSYLDGGIAEMLFYNRSLSAAEILQVEVYLANKWGIYHPNATWITSYSPFWQMLIHAWKLNKDDVGTNTVNNPFAAIYDPDAAPLGATTSLADVGRGVNTATEATNPPVNTANAIGTANGLLYNGTTTALNAGSNASIDDIYAAGGCYIGVIKPATLGQSNTGRIFDKAQSFLFLSATAKVGFNRTFSVSGGAWITTNNVVTLGAANIVGVTYSSADVSNDPVIYVNSLTAAAITETTPPTLTPSTDAASSMMLGNNAAGNRTADAFFGKQIFLKSIPTTEQRTAIYNFLAAETGAILV